MNSPTRAAVVLVVCLHGAGCAAHSFAPSFKLPVDRAEADIERMRETPVLIERPIVVLGGYMDPGGVVWRWVDRLQEITRGAPIIGVPFGDAEDFDDARAQVMEKVAEKLRQRRGSGGSEEAGAAPEVDVIAFSMGGLVARYAATPGEGDSSEEGEGAPDHLHIHRLFTISTPHKGAQLAAMPSVNPLHLAMRSGSDFLRALNRSLEDEVIDRLYAYVRIGDMIVGVRNAAPEGVTPWRVSGRPFEPAHLTAHRDPRIVADICRRIRYEPPLTDSPTRQLAAGSEEDSAGAEMPEVSAN